jgi:small subunit ribosomal protein S6
MPQGHGKGGVALMTRDYELMYIIKPDLDDEAIQAAVDSVATLITNNGGQVNKTTMWGKRRLAYEVDRLRDGHYVILKLQLDTTKVTEIERALRIHETVFRHLLLVDELTDVEDEAEETAAEGTSETATTTAPAATDEAEEPVAEADREPVAAGVDEEEN